MGSERLATDSAVPERRVVLGILGFCALAGGLLRAYLAIADDGLYWPDEIYQSLEPAHRWVFGYGMVAWEFVDGARNWTFPGLVGIALRTVASFGATSPQAYLTALKLLFAGVGVATGWGAFRLARSLGAPPIPATLAAAVVLLGSVFIYFSPRAMSETASALPVVLGLAFAVDPASSRRKKLLGAALLGLAVLLRIQNGVFCAGLVVWILAHRRWREALEATAVLLGFALFYGLLDKLTWGGFFHSAIKYLQFNLVEGKAAQWGTAAPSYYARILLRSMPALSAGTFLLALLAVRPRPRAWGLDSARPERERAHPEQAPGHPEPLGSARDRLRRGVGVLLIAFAFVALHSWTPHKELRFVLPVLPVFAALAAVGLSTLPQLAQKIGLALLFSAALWSAGRFHELTFGDLGQYEEQRPNASAYDDVGPVNRLLFAAHGRKDLCGLKVEAVHLAWSGGYSYLHRNVPLYSSFGPGRESGHFNYAIGSPQNGGQVVAHEAGLALIKLREDCVPDPGYAPRLP